MDELTCRKCGAAIGFEDVHPELGIAKCSACRTVMDLTAREASSTKGAAAFRPRERVPLPQRFEVDETGGGLTVAWRWFSAKYIGLLFFCITWDGFLVFWYTLAAKSGQVFMMIFPMVHVAVGVGLTYVTLAGFLNRSRVEARGGLLTIRHFPVPWPGNRELPAREIDQLFSEEIVTRGKNGTSISYQLNAIQKRDGRKLKLVSGFDEAQQALFLEQQIEKKLRIEDRPVEGELPRRETA